MKKTIIGVIIILAAVAVGTAGAYWAVKSRPAVAGSGARVGAESAPLWRQGRGMQPGGGFRQGSRVPGGMGRGMMGGQFGGYEDLEGERITLEQARQSAEEYAANVGKNLRVAEIMEFSDNFYAVVVEQDSGKGAFELLVHPVSGAAVLEPGPSRMWNLKYGHMTSANPSGQNSLSLEEAAALGQEVLDQQTTGAVISEDGFDFYGYYTFDYEIDGEVAGMLSVNGESGRVWFHTWHGEFIDEMEYE